MTRVDRLMGYLLLFHSRGLLRAQDFAEQFEISERTVYRDIEALCQVGVPIVGVPGEGYRLMEGYYLPPIAFTPDEARALYLAISMFAGLTKKGPTRSAAQSALEKIRAVLPVSTLRHVEALQAATRFYGLPGVSLDFDDQVFLTLQEAIHQQRVVHLRYHAKESNTLTERNVEPLELVFFDKVWMLIGYCQLRQGQRIFRLDRIDGLQIRPDVFQLRELADYREIRPETKVVVRFEASVVRWVRERQYFGLVEEQQLDNGDSVMSYSIRARDQMIGWLMSWGDRFDVLEPSDLRRQVAETAARIADRGQQRGGTTKTKEKRLS